MTDHIASTLGVHSTTAVKMADAAAHDLGLPYSLVHDALDLLELTMTCGEVAPTSIRPLLVQCLATAYDRFDADQNAYQFHPKAH